MPFKQGKWLEALLLGLAVSGFVASIFLAFVLALLPVSNQAQALVSVVLVGILMMQLFLLKRLVLPQLLVDSFRVTNIVIAIYLIFRYLVWRVEFTIGGYGFASDFFGTLLFLAELYAAGYAILGFFVTFTPRHRQPVPLPLDTDPWPVVDVLVPTYNEPTEIFRVTLLGALQIDYPKEKFCVHLLDDGGTDDRCANPKIAEVSQTRRRDLQSLCEAVGAIYHTRQHNNHAKAGNVNAALPSLNGDLIVILDADHVPTRDFLKNTAGFFLADPGCAMVQTPHSFINPDPVEKNLNIFHDSPAEAELFQRYIQAGLDSWDASFFVGSAAVIRRSLLQEIGGIQTETLTEDVETAMKLHSLGYRSVFLDCSQVLGLQPETVTSLISQRVRWAQGAIQILQMKNPLFAKGLSIAQRLTYITSFSYWLFPYARMINMLAPSMFLLFGVMIYNATIEQYLIYGAPYFLATWIYSDFVYGQVRWPLTSDVYEMVQTPLAAIMLFSTLLRPGKRPFNVTPKGEQLDHDFISSAAKVQSVFFRIILLSLVIGIWRWYVHPGERPQLVFTLLWELLNFIIITATMVVMLERRQHRENYRVPAPAGMKVDLELRDGSVLRLPALDLSMGGVGFSRNAWPAGAGQLAGVIRAVHLVDEERSIRSDAIPVKSIDGIGDRFGVRFAYVDQQQLQIVVRFLYGHSNQVTALLAARRRRLGFLAAYAYFLVKTGAGLWYWGRFLYQRGRESYLLRNLRQRRRYDMGKAVRRSRRYL